jgi:hypothetical protein
MKKIKMLLIVVVSIFACNILTATEVDFGFKSKWHRSKVYLKPAKEGFLYNCFKYYSVMSADFKEIKLRVKEEISLSLKIKGVGELKSDSAGFRFGIYSKNAGGKIVGYAVNCGVETKGISISRKTTEAPGLLSGKGFKGVGGAKSGSIGSEEFTDLKFTITNLGDNELEFKLYIDSVLTVKCKRTNMPIASFSKIALGTGGKVNIFIIKDLKVKKGE